MADPIRQLQGVELDSPNIIPEQQAPVPPPNVAPPLPMPEPVLAPATDSVPPVPAPLNVSTLTPQTPLQLPSPVIYGSDGVAPVAVSGATQALQVLAPIAQKDVANLRNEQAASMEYSLSPNALPPVDTWEPPDLEATMSNYGNNMAVLRQSFAAQTAARQNADERAWLERNMAAIEAMNNPKSSPTADAFGWVGEMLGTSEDGSRTYVGPAYFDKKSGDWKGSPVGGVLYGLGLLQNSVMGAGIDVKNMLRNVDKGMKSAYETFTPPWMRDSMAPALNTLGKVLGYVSPVVGMYQAAISGPGVSGAGTYNDGKSNFLEALRGAQFSFTDKISKGGLGIDANQGVRVPFPGTKGFDLNYGVVGGLAADILLGGKVDKLAGAALRRIGYSGTWTRAGAKKLAEEAAAPAVRATVQPPSVFKFTQGEIPFTSGPIPTNKVPRPKAAPKARPPVKGDVQQVLPIEQMMKEFGEADRLTNPLAYKAGRAGADNGQLSLRLGQIDSTPVVRNAPLKTPKLPSPGKQLKLDFTDLPEAVPPKNIKVARPVTELLDIADDVPLADLPPSVRGEVLNNMGGQIRARLNDNQLRMSVEPDIGRRPILSSERVPVPVYVPSGYGQILSTMDLPTEPLIHGTRVDNLVLNAADPAQGSALSELGAGIYMSTSRDVAEMATKAAQSEGLPAVAGRTFMQEGEGAIHSVQIRPGAQILDATAREWALETIVEKVAKNFPGLADRPRVSSPRSYIEVIDAMVELENSAAARLQFQQELTKALRAEGIDGVRGADNIAIFNPDVIQTTGVEKVTHLGMGPDDAYNARSALDDWGFEQNASELSKANALDAETVALNQRLNQLEADKRAASKETWQDIKYEGLMDHPSRVPTLDEYSRLVVDDLYSSRTTDPLMSGGSRDRAMAPEIEEKIKEAIARRGVSLEYKKLPLDVGGNFNPLSKSISVNSLTTKGDPSSFNNLNVLLHETFHSDIDKIVAYSGKGVTNNESVVESAANAVLSILDPTNATTRKDRFDWFFNFINSPEGLYAQKFGGESVALSEVKKQYGELIVKMVKETVEEIAPAGFKTPAINELRIFGPDSFESFAKDRYGVKSSIEKAFEGSITTIDEGLSMSSKIDALATNPVTGKLNTKVRDFLIDSFDINLTANQINPLIEKWANGLVATAGSNPARAKKAQAVLDLIQRGEGTADDYVAMLTKADKSGFKQYGPAIEKGVNDAQVRKYC